MPTAVDRRRFIAAAGAAIGAAALRIDTQALAASSSPYASYRSRPDLQPPRLAVGVGDLHDESRLFVAPLAGSGQYGPLILDHRAQPLWFRPLPAGMVAASFSVQTYRGERVLTWWEGKVSAYGWGDGEYVVVDQRYREVARIEAKHGLSADLHELVLTGRGTALFLSYLPKPANLGSVGGPASGQLVDCVVQEVDVASGAVVFEWHSVDHVAAAESYRPYPSTPGTDIFDYLHANSLCETSDGQLLLSGRHTCALYKIDRTTGRILWRLGGRKSDFKLGAGATFSYQHHARAHPGGLLTLFDNASYGAAPNEPTSRALVLRVDEARKRASLVRAVSPPGGGVGQKMGSVQLLDDGGMFVSWGDLPLVSEHSQQGAVRFSASLADRGYSYRAFRGPWEGGPRTVPSVAVDTVAGTSRVYVSWNGATQVAQWRVDGGPSAAALTPLATAPRAGFETAVSLPRPAAVVVAHALAADGSVLASSRPAIAA